MAVTTKERKSEEIKSESYKEKINSKFRENRLKQRKIKAKQELSDLLGYVTYVLPNK
ncbi:hypothetical protein [Maridesulfovibrio sp.]|uniref:hypothetical protein n=1 Tax=Maridesulfovibrio sp. TaxID=2795000 RepID=UPI002A18CCF9|nr:hypothetical protein [Maridesulfovibrio sp.]